MKIFIWDGVTSTFEDSGRIYLNDKDKVVIEGDFEGIFTPSIRYGNKDLTPEDGKPYLIAITKLFKRSSTINIFLEDRDKVWL